MSASRVAFAAVLVAAAWTTVVSGLVAVGTAKAEAAWLKSGSGNAFAAALPLSPPSTPTTSNLKCNRSGGTDPAVTVTWTYPIATLPPQFEVLTSPAANGPLTAAGTTTTTSATIPLPGNKTTYVSVRATAGAWRGPRSTEVAVC